MTRALDKEVGRAVALKADVASDEEVRALVGAVLERFGRLDILVNNAGVMVHGAFHEIPPSRYDTMFAVNVAGTMRCTYHALPAMMEGKHGRIINLSSQLAQRGVATSGFAAYAATKGAIESFTRAVAHEFGRYGVTANAIAPGGIETDMSRSVMTEEYRNRRLQELPLRRFGGVDDVAYCAVFLAADEAGYLTGQIIHPSGHRSAGVETRRGLDGPLPSLPGSDCGGIAAARGRWRLLALALYPGEPTRGCLESVGGRPQRHQARRVALLLLHSHGVSRLDALEVRPEHGNPAPMFGAEERPGVPVHLEHGHALGLDALGEADGGQRRPGESRGRQAEEHPSHPHCPPPLGFD